MKLRRLLLVNNIHIHRKYREYLNNGF